MAKKLNPAHSYVLTANDLASGDVVFWTGANWAPSILKAIFATGESQVEALENTAATQEAENMVVGAYLVPMQSGFQPKAMREQRRLAGPSIAYAPTNQHEPENLAA